MARKKESYNDAITQLKQIVSEIERGELDVDILSEKVTEASRLVKVCKEKLFKADEEVQKILEDLA
jgi:exodeoxyribonuclease VII small subunit